MYWDAPLVSKARSALGPEIASKCGVKQGDLLSPLLYGLFIDELEQWLHSHLPGAGVPLGPRLLQKLLYADDLVLLAFSPQQLQEHLHHLHQFCMEKGVGFYQDRNCGFFGNPSPWMLVRLGVGNMMDNPSSEHQSNSM
jgi:hypothetical protein